jgi:hypothetical protein
MIENSIRKSIRIVACIIFFPFTILFYIGKFGAALIDFAVFGDTWKDAWNNYN